MGPGSSSVSAGRVEGAGARCTSTNAAPEAAPSNAKAQATREGRTRGQRSTSPSANRNASVSAESATLLPLSGNAALAASATPSQAAGKGSNKADTARERRSTPANTTSTFAIANRGSTQLATMRACANGNPPGNSSRAATAAAPCAISTSAQNITATTRAGFMRSNRGGLERHGGVAVKPHQLSACALVIDRAPIPIHELAPFAAPRESCLRAPAPAGR